ncbi:MAG: class I SAM-dependent methyltransferase [Verrucomicrobiota bacterium]|nr:class I SAM-dependent methyltransferase [Verrucomicrobiota bacterium]
MCQCIAPTDAITERLFNATIQTLALYGVYLGRTLGLYRSLHRSGALNARELAASAGIAERYAREWLEQQAVAGFLVVDRDAADPHERYYRLPQEYVGVLVEDDDPAHVAPFAHMVVGIAGTLPAVVEAYRRGTGVDYHQYGADFRHGQSGINRPAFLHDLTGQWLPAIPDVHARLKTGRGVRIADVGCGGGWSAVARAQAYPGAEVIGYDLDEASIADARRNAREKGAAARFVCKDADEMAEDGPFDLVLLLETLHDMSRPREVLTALGRTLAPGGSILIADERVAERFAAPGNEIERLM